MNPALVRYPPAVNYTEVRVAMMRAGKRLKDVARELGYEESYDLYNRLVGRVKPEDGLISRLAEALGVDPSDLLQDWAA